MVLSNIQEDLEGEVGESTVAKSREASAEIKKEFNATNGF